MCVHSSFDTVTRANVRLLGDSITRADVSCWLPIALLTRRYGGARHRQRDISLRKPRIELVITEGEFLMFRLSLYVIGVSAMVAAWAAYRNQQKRKPIPVQ